MAQQSDQQQQQPKQQGGASANHATPNPAITITFDGYKGLNTKPSRAAIDQDECYILENFMPVGKSNLRTMWGLGSNVCTVEKDRSIVYFGFATLNTVPYCVVFQDDGSVFVVDTFNPNVVISVAPPGTLTSPKSGQIGLVQWADQYIVFSSSQDNGYFIWDGSNLFKAGTIAPDVSISNDGIGYTSLPNMTAIGGSGSGAVFSTSVQNGGLVTISVTSPGNGYGYADAGYIAFSAGGSQGETAIVYCGINGGGTITSTTIANHGAGYSGNLALSCAVLGGGGGGATITAAAHGGSITTISMWNNQSTTATTFTGNGYLTPPAIYVQDPNGAMAQAEWNIMPFGIKGTALESYQGHIWVCDGTKVIFTAPGFASNFDPGLGGGAFETVDSFIRAGFTGIRQANSFLNLFGDSSLNNISNVQTSAGSSTTTPTTTFSNVNVDPQFGTPWQNTICALSRNLVFANIGGIYQSYGGAIVKVSQALDAFFSNPPPLGNFVPSSALAHIFGIPCYILLFPVADPDTGAVTNKMFCWDSNRWFMATQEQPLIQISTQELHSVLKAYGTDGKSIWSLFQNPTTALAKTVQSKYWENDGYHITKVARRLYGALNYIVTDKNAPTSDTQASIYIDTNYQPSQAITINPAIKADQRVVQAQWYDSDIYTFGPIALSQPGTLIGLTFVTNAKDMSVVSLSFIEHQFSSNT